MLSVAGAVIAALQILLRVTLASVTSGSARPLMAVPLQEVACIDDDDYLQGRARCHQQSEQVTCPNLSCRS
jgi:hypothetical protein